MSSFTSVVVDAVSATLILEESILYSQHRHALEMLLLNNNITFAFLFPFTHVAYMAYVKLLIPSVATALFDVTAGNFKIIQ